MKPRKTRVKEDAVPWGHILEFGGTAFCLWVWSEMISCHVVSVLLFLGLTLTILHAGPCHFIYSLLKQRQWAFKTTCGIWILLTTAAWIVVYNNSRPRGDFSARAMSIITTRYPDRAGLFWFFNPGLKTGKIYPIQLIEFFQFTNLKPEAVMINEYWIETEVDGKWVHAVPFDVRFGSVVSVEGTNFQHARVVAWLPSTFDAAILNKSIAPGETIQGWMFLEMPREGVGKNWRFKIADASGRESVQPVVNYYSTNNPPSVIGQLPVFQGTQDFVDISQCQRPPYYQDTNWQDYKQPEPSNTVPETPKLSVAVSPAINRNMLFQTGYDLRNNGSSDIYDVLCHMAWRPDPYHPGNPVVCYKSTNPMPYLAPGQAHDFRFSDLPAFSLPAGALIQIDVVYRPDKALAARATNSFGFRAYQSQNGDYEVVPFDDPDITVFPGTKTIDWDAAVTTPIPQGWMIGTNR